MGLKIAAYVLVAALLQPDSYAGSFELPDLLDREKYDEDAYVRMLPDDEILLSRRREDPETNEESWNDDEDTSKSSSSVTFTSNMDDAKNVVFFNGIDIAALPANYHNTTTITRKIGNNTVTANVTIDKTTDPVTGQTSISVVETSNSNGVGMNQCTSSKACETGQYCRHLLYGDFCSKCNSIEERCNSDDQCCGTGTKGALCVRGICQNGFKKGEAGTTCKTKTDCNSGMCCARQFMKRNGECKALAKKGEKCSASRGVLSTILHPGLCPCESGLACSSSSSIQNIFGGSMNTILGGNTCRTKGSKSSFSGWRFGPFDDDFDDVFGP